MLEIQTGYHEDGVTYVRFIQDGKTGEAWLQLPNSQTSRHNIVFDGAELEEDGVWYQHILDGLLKQLHELYPDRIIFHLFAAGCDVDYITNITEKWEDGWRKYFVELNEDSTEKYKEASGDHFYLVKEE